MEIKETGKKIKQRRKELKMSLEKLGDIVGVSKQTIFRYEDGTIENIPLDKVSKIAEALKVSTTYLLGIDVELDYADFLELKGRRYFKALLDVIKEMTDEEMEKLIGMAKLLK